MLLARRRLLLVLWRLLWAYLSQTWYVPDETWQSVEVSHKMVFGTGYLTWEWNERIRSSLHPLLFAIPLQVLKVLSLDSQWLVVLAPKLVQALITALGEAALCTAVSEKEGRRVGDWLFILITFNWHGLYTGSRTLINTLEYSLTCLALAHYIRLIHQPSNSNSSNNNSSSSKAGQSYLALATVCVMIRPTAGLVWAPLVLLHVVQLLRQRQLVQLVVLAAVCLTVAATCLLVDSLFYGQLTLVPLNFFMVNVYRNLGVNYGSHPWHWYLSQGLTGLLGPLVVPLVLALRRRAPPLSHLTLPLIGSLVFLSLLPHKEMRFLQPVLPFAFCLISGYLATTTTTTTVSATWWMRAVFISSNLLLALYLSLVHQRGAVDAALWLGAQDSSGPNDSVLFLTPCHSTPYYSHFHSNISARFLRCEPNLSGEQQLDEADTFYADPSGWLAAYHRQAGGGARWLVLYDQLLPRVQSQLTGYQYRLCQSFFHTHFPEGRLGSRLLVMCKM